MAEDTLHKAGEVAAQLPGLLLEAGRVAHSVMKGAHGRRRVGPGETFWQFRHYMPGDSSRDIDWKQTARRDDAYVRELEWESAQTAWMYRDASPSMHFRSSAALPEKKDYAEVLLLSLSMLLLHGGERVGLLGTPLGPQAHPSSIRRIYDMLPAQNDFAAPARPLPPRSHAVLFSDFYFPPQGLEAFCARLAQRGISGLLVQVCDPSEEKLDYTGRVKFLDMEAPGAALTIPRVEAVRDLYAERFAAHRAALADMAGGLGWRFAAFSTATPPARALCALYDLAGGG